MISAILKESMKPPKKTSTKSINTETPKTDNLVNEVQFKNVPFHRAFYELLELARAMELEVFRLKNFNKPRKKNEKQLELGRSR